MKELMLSKRVKKNLQSLWDCARKTKGHPKYLEIEMISGSMLVFDSIAKMKLMGEKLVLWIKGDRHSYTFGVSFIKGVLWVS